MEWFHLYEVSRTDKFIEKERIEATRTGVSGNGLLFSEYIVFVIDEKVLVYLMPLNCTYTNG